MCRRHISCAKRISYAAGIFHSFRQERISFEYCFAIRNPPQSLHVRSTFHAHSAFHMPQAYFTRSARNEFHLSSGTSSQSAAQTPCFSPELCSPAFCVSPRHSTFRVLHSTFCVQIPKKRNVYSAPAVRSVRLKRCKHDFPLRPAASGEKGVPTAAGGRGGKPFPRERSAGNQPAER